MKVLLHCEMFRATCLAMFWRHCGGTGCKKQFHSVTYPATAKIVARQNARKVELNSNIATALATCLATIFGRCRACYTVKYFVGATCPAKTLREKLHETFHSVTAP